MAINTRNRRASVQAYTVGLARPLADGTIDASDRATSGWHYAGLAYSGAITPPSVGDDIPVQYRRRFRR